MRSLVRAAATLVVALTVGACSSASHSAPKVAASQSVQGVGTVASSCTAAVSGANLSTWQSVTASGFSFCLPPDWRGRGYNWRATTATMEWGLGKARSKPVKVTERRVVSRSEIAAGVRPSSDGPAGADIQRFTDQIDGRPVQVWRNKLNGKYYVGGQWESPHVFLLGEADDARAADTQMLILRTVRFVAK